MFLFLFLFCVKCAIIPTDCNIQLHNYYVAKGLDGGAVPVQPALSFNSGIFMGNPYVEVTIAFQAIARYYQSFIDASFVPWSVEASLDIPWCADQINILCCDNVSVAMAKTGACTTLVDFDLGGTNPVAGRMFIYHNQSIPACNGTSVIRFSNTSLQAFFDADYTYDAVGLRDFVQLNWADARQFYRNSTCLYSDGDPADIVTQDIFRCTAQRIGCSVPRTNGRPTVPVVPIPKYRCSGNLTTNGTKRILWTVYSYQEPIGIDTIFGFGFTSSLSSGSSLADIFSAIGSDYVLLSGGTRQIDSGFDTFTHYALMAYNGYVTAFSPVYALSFDPIIREIPCICGFSMSCLSNGEADLTSLNSGNVYLSNAIPVPDPGPNIQIPVTTSNFTLNATPSYDPDGLPGVLSVYWKIYSTPYSPGPPPFTITNPTAFINVIDSSTLLQGQYIFILYVSDSQEVTFTFFNVTIQPNQLEAITEPRKIVTFDFYTGTDPGHNCLIDFPPYPFITLDGSLSHGTDPNIPITYQWIQTGGIPTNYKCDEFGFETTRGFFNTTEPIAFFIPPTIGRYYFRLTVCDNVTCVDSLILEVAVFPDFQQPPSTFTPIINFTDSPIRNLTPPTRPNYTLPNFSFPPLSPPAPVAGPPPSNITVPPLFPIYPPPTYLEWIGLLVVGGFMIILFFLIAIAWLIQSRRTNYSYLDTVSYGPGMRRF